MAGGPGRPAGSRYGGSALDRVLPRIGGIETVARLAALSGSDFTSVMLEVTRRRARGPEKSTARLAPVRLAAVQRVVRAQQFPAGYSPHFGLLGLVTAGRDQGSLRFERSALTGQLRFAIRGVAASGAEKVQIVLTPLSDPGERITAEVIADLGAEGAELVTDRGRQAGRGYYRDLCFKVNAYVGGQPREIGDGGFTDWTARLIANQKERLLISGLSTDRLAAIRSPAGPG